MPRPWLDTQARDGVVPPAWVYRRKRPRAFIVVTSRNWKTGRRKTVRVRARSMCEAAGIVEQRHAIGISRVWLAP